jgi:phosphonate transport system ATP-binding protein
MELLQKLNRTDGLTVIVTLHQVDHAVRYCPRVVALQTGKVVYDGPSSGLSRSLLAEIYGDEIEEALDPLGAQSVEP